MATDTLSEGTRVKILKYEWRPELVGLEAETGSLSAKDGTYECWLTGDKFEGALAWLKREDFELMDKPPEVKASDGTEPPMFGVGDRVKGKESGHEGTVTAVDADGDPKVKMDGDSEAQQRFGKEFEIVSKASFGVGDRVRGKDSGKVGTVVAVDADGDPKVKMDEEPDAKQRFGKEFDIIVKGGFSVGDRVRGKDSLKPGTVVAVDADGDPKVKMDDEPDAKQRFGKEFDIVKKAEKEIAKRSRSKSGGKKKKKKKKGDENEVSSSSDSSSSKSSSSDSGKKKKKKGKASVFGKSTLELLAEQKKAQAKHAKKYGKHRSSGADSALAFLALR